MAPKRAREGATAATKPAKSAKAAKAEQAALPDIEDFSPTDLQQVRASLLDWYDANHRILPWRRNPNSKLSAATVEAAAAQGHAPAPAELPQNEFIYYVWVCEIMSQQTQVSRAAEYFRRWVARWPTVQALAGASQEEVNELWAGLGYYRRARYLLDGAKYIVGECGGRFPTTAKELQAIPGVGAYTSAAIASIACGEQAAVVDGNVIRVLARLRRVGGDPRSAAATKLWAELAEQLLDPDRPGCFNQAMMELGATVCVPNAEPRCGDCPISAACLARKAVLQYEQEGGDPGAAGAPRVTDYPTKVEKAEKREETVAVAVVQLVPPGTSASGAAGLAASRFLLVQRPPSGLLAGLWQFPLLQLPEGAEEEPARQQQMMSEYLEAQLGLRLVQQQGGSSSGSGGSSSGSAVAVLERRPLGSLVHVFSHIRMTMKVERILLQGDISTADRAADDASGLAALQWVPGSEMQGKGLSSGVKKIYKLFMDDRSKAGSKQSITAFFKPAATK
ncbi:hypothetical protein COHA_005262 [Chlorella ohadii]|uniref:Adenine DNA glycosylase n=1 Tax=Chlorella ohadii TaxID=2649997 RepID=A0AAD5DVC5_9CHLO|nr:hypothetical protein COHA_005262 [Chlorella ohadii]